MKYKDKDISSLTIQELTDVSFKLSAMRKRFDDAILDPRYEERFKNQPDRQMNANFLELEKAINQEIKNRK